MKLAKLDRMFQNNDCYTLENLVNATLETLKIKSDEKIFQLALANRKLKKSDFKIYAETITGQNFKSKTTKAEMNLAVRNFLEN